MLEFDFNYVIHIIPMLLKALNTTLMISLLSLIIALIISIFLTLIRFYKIKVIYIISELYVSFFRATPLIAQLFLFYFGIATNISFIKNIKPISAAIVVLSLNASAYMSEIMRAALESVDIGQLEAGLSVGMTNFQAMRRIVIPQAFRTAIPPLFNTFIDIIKGSSLAFTIGVTEIMAAAKIEGAVTYKYFECYIALALIFWIMVSIFGIIQKKLEIKMNQAY